MAIDIDRVCELIRTVSAQEILPRFRNLARDEVQEKAPGSLVTIADTAAEQALTRALTDLLPGSAVIGEEAVEAGDGRVPDAGTLGHCWIIDPIDGTGNFAGGRPAFACMVALAVDGVTVAAWIHDPVTDRMVVAEQGGGARDQDGPLRIDAVAPLADLPVNPKLRRRARRGGLTLNGPHLHHNSAAHDYMAMSDRTPGACLYNRLMPWDHAPGALILTEAGGRAAFLDGRPYSPRVTEGAILLDCSDPEHWPVLAEAMRSVS